MSRKALVALLAAVCVFTLAGTAHADAEPSETTCACGNPPKHVLYGHAYLPSFVVADPFADSTVRLSLGAGIGNYGTTGLLGNAIQLNLGAFQPRLNVQVNVWDGLALSVGANANIITGLNNSSVLNYGGSVGYNLEAGILFEFFRDARGAYSIALDVQHPRSFSVSPLTALTAGVTAALSGGSPEFVNSTVKYQWRPTARAAFTLSSVFALKAIIGASINTSDTDSDLNRTHLIGGLSLEAELNPIHVPIGITANYLRGQIITHGSNVNIYDLGLYETLSKTFNAGLEFGRVHAGGLDTTVAAVTVQVYYN